MKSRHESGLRGPGEALEQCLLGAELVRDDAAAVTGPFPDPGQRQRAHAMLDGQLGGGVPFLPNEGSLVLPSYGAA
jgi:hypothetical protein